MTWVIDWSALSSVLTDLIHRIGEAIDIAVQTISLVFS